MRTLDAMPREKQRRIAKETIEIYAPIANRLGVRQWAYELDRLSFATLYPLRYAVLKQTMKQRQGNRKAIVSKVGDAIVSRLEAEGIAGDVTGREKHLYSIYRKMKEKTLTFDEIYDVYAFRITVDSVDTCYRVLGVIHSLYKPIPGRFKDYLAIPKTNGYQSLHTVVFGPYGLSLEIQIRTEEMHRVADVGVAAHWLYKSGAEGAESEGKVQQQALQWLKDLLDIQQKAGNSSEFLEHLKIDLFPDEVYVFTPKGEIKKLPRDVTVVDFAYDVHSDVGHRCIGAKVNYKLVPLRTRLKNGDHVEIITSEWGRPTPSWLNYVVTSRARAHIRSYLKSQKNEESTLLGERLLDKAVSALGFELESFDDKQKKKLLKKLQIKKWPLLLEEIGIGNRVSGIVARQLVSDQNGSLDGDKTPGLAISGTEGVVVTYGKCCRPIPGDPVLGYLSAGKGIVVHTAECHNVAKFQKHPDRWLDVTWEKEISGVFQVEIRVESRNKQGTLASVASAISEMNANIDKVSLEEREGDFSAMNFIIEVRDRVHLAKVMRKIHAQEFVIRISRIKG
jgi:RelA/SpoT family (p)ppGpp synthetase